MYDIHLCLQVELETEWRTENPEVETEMDIPVIEEVMETEIGIIVKGVERGKGMWIDMAGDIVGGEREHHTTRERGGWEVTGVGEISAEDTEIDVDTNIVVEMVIWTKAADD